MDGAMLKLMHPTRMVEVNVRRDRQQWLVEQRRDVMAQTRNAQPCIDQQILGSPFDQPQICAVGPAIVGFRDQLQAITDLSR
jgi:hypothetical protein